MSPVIHRHVGASAFSADYRARQLLPQESHPSQHSWLSSASPTRSVGQARWHRHTSTCLGLWAGFGSLLGVRKRPTCAPAALAEPSALQGSIPGGSSGWRRASLKVLAWLCLWLEQKQEGQGTGPQALSSSPHIGDDPFARAMSRRLQGVSSAWTWQCPGPCSPKQHLVAMGTHALMTLQ